MHGVKRMPDVANRMARMQGCRDIYIASVYWTCLFYLDVGLQAMSTAGRTRGLQLIFPQACT